MIIRCIDVETTGLEASDRVVELGWCDVEVRESEDAPEQLDSRQIVVGQPMSLLFNPGVPIPPVASGVHHITDDDVRFMPEFKWSDDELSAICAHNARFEQMFVPTKRPWICTYKLALKLAPNAPGHGLQTLRYWLKMDLDQNLVQKPHRAAPDAYICAKLLERILRKLTLKQCIEISSQPALLPCFTFGKHAMVPLEDVPVDYLHWILGKRAEFDEDVVYTAAHYESVARTRQRGRSPV